MGFHADLQKLCVILRKNLFPEPFPENLINKYISKYIQTVVKRGKTQPHSGVEPQETPKFYFKIPYVRGLNPGVIFDRPGERSPE